MSIPQIGVGTFRLKEQAAIDSVRTALDVGYRAVDELTALGGHDRGVHLGRAACHQQGGPVGGKVAGKFLAGQQLFDQGRIAVVGKHLIEHRPDASDSAARCASLRVASELNGDGIDEIGVYRSGQWIIDSNNNIARSNVCAGRGGIRFDLHDYRSTFNFPNSQTDSYKARTPPIKLFIRRIDARVSVS